LGCLTGVLAQNEGGEHHRSNHFTPHKDTKWLTGNHKHQSLYCGSFNRASFTLYKLFSLEVMQCLDYAMLKRSAANVYSDMSINLNIHVTF